MKQKECRFFMMGLHAFMVGFFAFFAVDVRAIETLREAAQGPDVGIIDTNSQVETKQEDDSKDDEEEDEEDDDIDLSKKRYRPENLSVAVLGTHKLHVTWKDNAKEEKGYKLDRRTVSGAWHLIATLPKNTESYLDSSVVPDTIYYYRVYAYDNKNETGYSNEGFAQTEEEVEEQKENMITTAAPTGIIAEEENLERFPQENVQEESQVVQQEIRAQENVCTIAQIPAQELDAAIRERCDTLSARTVQKLDDATGFMQETFYNKNVRLILSIVLLLIVINNVIWHMTHKSKRTTITFDEE